MVRTVFLPDFGHFESPTAEVLEFAVGWPPRALWVNRRAHYHARNGAAVQYAAEVAAAIAVARPRDLCFARAELSLIAMLPTHNRFDLDGLLSACKPLIDTIVRSGLLADDGIEVLTGLHAGWRHDPSLRERRVWVQLEGVTHDHA